jgi:hypothetical protein
MCPCLHVCEYNPALTAACSSCIPPPLATCHA